MARSTAASRARKPKATKNGAASLIEALRFIALAQQKEGTPAQTHCAIGNGCVVAFNGVFAAGHLIEDDLSACPHTMRLLDALNKCGETVSITQLDSGRLSVKSDKFRALIPCIPFDQLIDVGPDEPCAEIDDRIKAGFEMVAPVLSDTPQRAMLGAALLQAGSIVGTNGHMLLEYWHGIDLPPGLLIPKAACIAVSKAAKKLTKFGFTDNSATFFFEDDSFIKTQLFADSYPDYDCIFPEAPNPWPAPVGLFDAIRKVQSLADDKIVHFNGTSVSVMDAQRKEAGSFDVDGLPDRMAFNMDYLFIAEESFKQVEFDTKGCRVLFFGDNVRGAIMGIKVS